MRSDWWMWQEEPAARTSGLAMKVSALPLAQAISLAAFLTTTWASAAGTASSYWTLISSWPALASPFDDSTGMPAPFSPVRIARITSSSLVVWKM